MMKIDTAKSRIKRYVDHTYHKYVDSKLAGDFAVEIASYIAAQRKKHRKDLALRGRLLKTREEMLKELDEFNVAAAPLIKLLNTKYDPHTTAVITTNCAQLVEGTHCFYADHSKE